jgi:hypothetical protein
VVDAGLVVVPEAPGEGHLGVVLAGDGVLLRGEAGAELVFVDGVGVLGVSHEPQARATSGDP